MQKLFLLFLFPFFQRGTICYCTLLSDDFYIFCSISQHHGRFPSLSTSWMMKRSILRSGYIPLILQSLTSPLPFLTYLKIEVFALAICLMHVYKNTKLLFPHYFFIFPSTLMNSEHWSTLPVLPKIRLFQISSINIWTCCCNRLYEL